MTLRGFKADQLTRDFIVEQAFEVTVSAIAAIDLIRMIYTGDST